MNIIINFQVWVIRKPVNANLVWVRNNITFLSLFFLGPYFSFGFFVPNQNLTYEENLRRNPKERTLRE